MTKKLHWHTEGEGSDLVLIHGWGMNGAVWQQVLPLLAQDFCVHVVDLPGYGLSNQSVAENVEEMAQQLLDESPQQAAWLGWSLGGLVAKQAALTAPDRLSHLVTVASSPKFAAADGWRGIKPQVLEAFTNQLREDFTATVERFMALQAMGSLSAKQDIKWLKQAVFSRPEPHPDALLSGLKMLADVDLRHRLVEISIPWLRLYGRLDGLVPVRVADALDKHAPGSGRQVFARSSHAPFISESEVFVAAVKEFLL